MARTREVTEINGEPIAYWLDLSRTNHNRSWSATIEFDGQQRTVSQELLVSEPNSEASMKILAENLFHFLYRDMHPDRFE